MMDHELHYVIVGKTTAHTTRLQRVAKSLGVLDRIHFITNATEEEMPAIYKRASILINISKYEGFPTSVAEAMSVGTPCIASRKLCMEEIAENSALYVSATNRDEIISTIRRLLEDKELRDDLIATGKRHASRFRPEVVAFNLINYYHRIGVNIRG